MLLYFKVANSRSFDEEVEFSMIASDYGDLLPENTIYLKKYNIHVLKSAVIYGANASGKSNLLIAMNVCKFIILELKGDDKENFKPYFLPNRNYEKNETQPTTYKLGFVIKGICYEYSFSNTLERIHEEKLIEFKTLNHEVIHYHRRYNAHTQEYEWSDFSEMFKSKSEPIKVFTKKDRLLLSVANQLPDESSIDLVSQIVNWLHINFSNYAFTTHDTETDREEKQEAFKLIRRRANKNWFLNHLKETDFLIKDVNIELVVDEDAEEEFVPITFHEGKNKKGEIVKIPFNFGDESTGTQDFTRWLFLMKEAIKNNKILVLDEFHNSLHLHLTEYLIKFFHRESKQAQLIFATHDVKLMQSEQLFRPDQIWLVKRDKNGNSQLDPLSNYVIDENYQLDNMYLEGFFGGIPNIRK